MKTALFVYILSALFSYFTVRKDYSRKGVMSNLDPDWGDVFWVICPIFNSFFVFIEILRILLTVIKWNNFPKFFFGKSDK